LQALLNYFQLGSTLRIIKKPFVDQRNDLKPTISVILNVYKRSAYFEEQLRAIHRQTVKPIEILVWENGDETVPEYLRDGLTITRSNKNFGVWARFAYALNAKGAFVCVFDDDTIPGPKWFENCLNTMKQTPGLLGARGVIFDNKNSYSINQDVGIYAPNEQTQIVDIVGHSWFFKYEWLSTFWKYGDQRFREELAGEDIHFSYALQKNLSIPTLVPKHPINDVELWGASPELSKLYGSDSASISISNSSLKKFEDGLQHYRKLGFKTLSEIEPRLPSKHPNFLYKLVRRFPSYLHYIAKLRKQIINLYSR
jgi:glycosyltransferase involved in cell wall biosynthesis